MLINLPIFTVLLCFELTEQRIINSEKFPETSRSMHDFKGHDKKIPENKDTQRHMQIHVLLSNIIDKFKLAFQRPIYEHIDRDKRSVETQHNNTTTNNSNNSSESDFTLITTTTGIRQIIVKAITSYPSKGTSYIASVTQTESEKTCDNAAACLYPYVSYFAGIVMFLLIVYLTIVFGRCVCDDSY
ncbi:Hypothetical predicted protein [Mytilus galloprovincialis]|uniref:Uncharacterized protein n=1 Tax=Mytilus galloprovincialis TaxID=29158 RepID=A0A8B6BTU7_MYTGA|nr:Hypothetical predicted protein [Mytilus galloprovincialis]